MKTNKSFWSYLAPFFLECEMFHKRVAEKIKYTFYVEQRFFENFKVYETMWTNNLETTGHR